jgi:hypothetical protein
MVESQNTSAVIQHAYQETVTLNSLTGNALCTQGTERMRQGRTYGKKREEKS